MKNLLRIERHDHPLSFNPRLTIVLLQNGLNGRLDFLQAGIGALLALGLEQGADVCHGWVDGQGWGGGLGARALAGHSRESRMCSLSIAAVTFSCLTIFFVRFFRT